MAIVKRDILLSPRQAAVEKLRQRTDPVVGGRRETNWEQVRKTVREELNLKPPKVTRK